MRVASGPALLSPFPEAVALRGATMPADARGHVRKLPSGKWQLRYYDKTGIKRTGGSFGSKTDALNHYRDVVEPELHGRPAARCDLTLQELADVFLERHAAVAKPRTIETLRGRLSRPLAAFGSVPLADLEGMTDEVAGFAATLPERYRYAVVSALRQTLETGVRYGYLTRNPAKLAGKNPQPPPRPVRIYTADELKRLAGELGTRGAAAIRFAAATGLRPGEWAELERRDVDRARRIVQVRGTKTYRSRREVPLTTAALAAIETLPPRIDSVYLFSSTRRGPFDVNNFRRREWGPAIEAASIEKPARIYDLRSTFASNALAAGLTTFELARIMGTSIGMIEAHYGTLIDTAHDAILARLDAVGGV